jgi:arylsulfate sulfotransferase
MRPCRICAVLAMGVALLTSCGVTSSTTPPSSSPPSQPPPVASQSGSVSLSPAYAALSPGQTLAFRATAASGGPLQWLVDGVAGGNTTVGSIDATGIYRAPASIAQSENVTVTAALSGSPQANYATAGVSILQPGEVLATANPQVATYSIYLPAPGRVAIQFGPSTEYGLETWAQATPSANGGEVSLYVAGMLGQTGYHMRAQVSLDDGATWTDADHTFTTGTPPPTSAVTASTVGGQAPQPGIEMWDTLIPDEPAQVFATDLNGNVIWTYRYVGSVLDTLQGIQLLPNGHFLVLISYLSSLTAATASRDAGTIDAIREVDLAGNTIRELDMATLNQKLAAGGYSLSLKSFHHSVLALPNGHWVLLAAYPETFQNLPGYPGTTSVLGDVLVDVDENFDPDWVWNAFDHLDLNRHPMNFPDWTHANDLLYSADDHDLLLSLRHQNWILKIDFQDGQGSGNVLWRLGEGGDFQLQGGTDPTDWFYAQHGMSFFSTNTAGVFALGLLDNGNDRDFPSGAVLCQPHQPTSASCYSTFPVLQVNEAERTATLITHYIPPPSYFSFFGGNAEPLANGDAQVNFCAPPLGAIVQELTSDGNQLVWQATTPGADQFHVDRLGSLYPGVIW